MKTAHKRRLVMGFLLLLGLAVLPSYMWAFKLTSSSASPTISIGGAFLVNKAAYSLRLPYSKIVLLRTGAPRRGDIALFQHPDLPIMGPKRVMGLPGETIEFKDNRVVINGRQLPLKPLDRRDFGWVAPVNHIGSEVYDEDGHWISFTPGSGQYRTCPPIRLGAHEYFLVGDNRDNSIDSRNWGPFAERQLLGKVAYIYKR